MQKGLLVALVVGIVIGSAYSCSAPAEAEPTKTLTTSGAEIIFNPQRLGDCTATKRWAVRRDETTLALFECTDAGTWQLVDNGFNADAGSLVQANRDVHAKSFVASAMAADGGSGKYGYKCENSPCVTDFGAGTQDEVSAENNTLTWNVSDQIFSTFHVTQPANVTGSNVRWYADTGKFFGLFPTADTTGCGAASDDQGGMRAMSDGGLTVCDGTTLQRVGYVLKSEPTSLDFGDLAAHASETLTISVPGAVTGGADIPLCRPVTEPTADIDIHEWVSAADTVSLKAHNDSGGNVNPAATTYTCIVIR